MWVVFILFHLFQVCLIKIVNPVIQNLYIPVDRSRFPEPFHKPMMIVGGLLFAVKNIKCSIFSFDFICKFYSSNHMQQEAHELY